MKILVTGGAGYVGSHTVVELLSQNHEAVIIDNLSNSKEVVIDRIETITGSRPLLIKADVRDTELLAATMVEYDIDAVVHFAALKAVGESVENPLLYYEVNVG